MAMQEHITLGCLEENGQTFPQELYIWLSIIIYQGIHKEPSVENYWSVDSIKPMHPICRQMTYVRFMQIKRYFHISPSGLPCKNYYDKAEPLMSHIRDTSKRLYTPKTNVSIDEMMIKFSGRSVHTVRIKNKPTPEGFKIFSLCDAGYTYIFIPTSRVASPEVEVVEGLNQTGCVVAHLVQHLPYKKHAFNI